MEVGLKQLRSEISNVFKLVRKGENITITQRGRPIAVIKSFPLKEEGKKFEPVGFGIWADREDLKDVKAWLKKSRNIRYSR